MIAEAIQTILDSAAAQNGRESHLTILDKTAHETLHYLYSDDAHEYELVHTESTPPAQTGAVSNVESFVALVREETLRRAPGSEAEPLEEGLEPPASRRRKATSAARHDGSFMTVIFNASGAKFSPDDRVRIDSFSYQRVHSPQWVALTSNLNKAIEHKELIRVLQRLRPSITTYDDLMRQLRKISFSDKTSIASEPLLTAGQQSNDYRVDIEVRSGGVNGPTTSQTALPSEFDVELQYARGSEKRYATKIEIDLSTVMKGDRRELRFTLIAPDLPNVEELAIDDEVAYFRAETTDIPRLLVLQDY